MIQPTEFRWKERALRAELRIATDNLRASAAEFVDKKRTEAVWWDEWLTFSNAALAYSRAVKVAKEAGLE